MEGWLVEQEAVRLLPVLAQRLTMVRDRHHHGARRFPAAVQSGEKPPHLGVDEGDLARIGVLAVTPAVGLGGLVRGVGVVQVNPKEIRAPVFAAVLYPREGPVHHRVAAALGFERIGAGGVAAVDLVIVRLEAAPEAEAMIEHESAYERAISVPCGG